jgi:M6 family metalloprotease-like protein
MTSIVDITSETGLRVTGSLTSWTVGDVEHIAGRSTDGDLMVFWRSPRTDRWQAVNASAEAGARVAGPVAAWATRSGNYTVEHLAGRDANGNLIVFWWSPRTGRWQSVNASGEAGHRVTGPVAAWTMGDVEHLAGRGTNGDLIVFWWSPRTRTWRAVNASAEAGQRVAGPVVAWTVGDVEHLAGPTTGGDLIVFWWSPRTRKWQAVDASAESGALVDGPVGAWMTKSGDYTVEHLAGRNANGELMVFWWSPRAGRWQAVNAGRIASASGVAGQPAAFLPAGIEALVTRTADNHLQMFWWSPALDWQVCDLTDATGRRVTTDPSVWISPDNDRAERIAGRDDRGHLLIFTTDGEERHLTDSLQRPFLSMRPSRNLRHKVVTILWDAHRPGVPPRPSRETVEGVIEGGVNSVRDYFLEVSRGAYTIENVATLGWYESDHTYTEYWPPAGSVGRDSGAEAIRKAARDFNFAAYDTNHDGNLRTDELFVLFVQPGSRLDGGGLGCTVGEDYVPRGEGQGIVVDGVRITTIAEISIGSPPGPGIVAHEAAHPLLGLGDMYWDGQFNPMAAGPYSLMDKHGAAPHIDPAQKLKLGWLRPRVVFRSGTYRLPDVERFGIVLVLLNPARSRDEYFLVENRWPGTSYDRALGHAGLGVWHVIENPDEYRLPPEYLSAAEWLDPDNDGREGPVGWTRQGIRMVRPLHARPFASTLPLWDGAQPATGYNLLSIDPDPAHAELRWADLTPSGIAIRTISPAGPEMTMTLEVP